jgi:hypothetical protein
VCVCVCVCVRARVRACAHATLLCTATKLVYLHPYNTTAIQTLCDIGHEGKLHFVN